MLSHSWMAHRYKHEITNHQKSREQDGETEEAQAVQWIGERDENVLKDFLWMRQHVPTVPTLETPQVDTQSTQPEREKHEYPAQETAQVEFHQSLHGSQRSNGQEDASPGESGQHKDVVPHGDVIIGREVEEIGNNVRRVGEEEQPDPGRRDQKPPAPGERAV